MRIYTYFRASANDARSLEFCDEKDAEYILVPVKEFNGYKNALRILNDRALQQIDKSKTDSDGFRLLRADFRKYKKSGKLWLITKETPYSSKISLRDASFLIEEKLRDTFYFTDDIDLDNYSDVEVGNGYTIPTLEYKDIALIRKQWHDKEHRRKFDFLHDNSAEGRAIYNCWSAHPGMVVEISKISVNYAQGLYEVSYWATECI